MKNEAGTTALSEHIRSCLLNVCLLDVLLPSHIAYTDVSSGIDNMNALSVRSTTWPNSCGFHTQVRLAVFPTLVRGSIAVLNEPIKGRGSDGSCIVCGRRKKGDYSSQRVRFVTLYGDLKEQVDV
jgi:hypothetical protein